MKTAAKIGIGVLFIAGAVWVAHKVKSLAAQFRADIAGYGTPTVNSYLEVTLPIKVRFNNPTAMSIEASQVWADIYLWKTDRFEKVGQVAQSLSLTPGESEQTLLPVISLNQVFGGFLDTLKSTIKSKALKVRTDLTIHAAGFSFPTQTFINEIRI